MLYAFPNVILPVFDELLSRFGIGINDLINSLYKKQITFLVIFILAVVIFEIVGTIVIYIENMKMKELTLIITLVPS